MLGWDGILEARSRYALPRPLSSPAGYYVRLIDLISRGVHLKSLVRPHVRGHTNCQKDSIKAPRQEKTDKNHLGKVVLVSKIWTVNASFLQCILDGYISSFICHVKYNRLEIQ